jgi:putative endonuclease
MGNTQAEVGKWGEDLGAKYLEKNGYKIIDRNYRTPAGEIDLVAVDKHADDPYLVFVEVKTRTNDRYGYPEEAFTQKKWHHLINAIDYYFEDNQQYAYDWRIDVIAIRWFSPDIEPELKHFENIVFPDGEDE